MTGPGPGRFPPAALFAGAGWLVLAAALLHPPRGLGVEICMTKRMLDVQCPGCGLTRSVSCAARGMWHESVSHHPLGIIVLVVAAALALWPLIPTSWRAALGGHARRHRWLAPVGALIVAWALVAVTVSRLVG